MKILRYVSQLTRTPDVTKRRILHKKEIEILDIVGEDLKELDQSIETIDKIRNEKVYVPDKARGKQKK